MDEKFIERLAERLARQYVKETSFTTQKWEKMASTERSTWRLLARAATEMVLEEASTSADK